MRQQGLTNSLADSRAQKKRSKRWPTCSTGFCAGFPGPCCWECSSYSWPQWPEP